MTKMKVMWDMRRAIKQSTVEEEHFGELLGSTKSFARRDLKLISVARPLLII